MEILNKLPAKRFREIDDLLAFISIYDDQRRTESYFKMLEANAAKIEGAVCVEAGCGLGVFSSKMAELGAKKVYAVEQNPILARLAKQRLKAFKNVEVVHAPIQTFLPSEPVDLLLHEFYGQLLYDEDLYALKHLRFSPREIMPDGGALLCGAAAFEDYADEHVTPDAIAALKNALVAGLFESDEDDLQTPVLKWRAGEAFPEKQQINIEKVAGNLVVFGVQVTHGGEQICLADQCDNWATVWTPRCGNAFEIGFQNQHVGEEVTFRWL